MNIKIAVVIIGRNEGERLERCLKSVIATSTTIVYVDSGSTDNSVSLAAKSGAYVLNLDMSKPFSAGRARNKGFNYIYSKFSEIKFVQFIDGDSELSSGWIDTGIEYLKNHPGCGIVAGKVKEKFPENSIYNRLCDIEWNSPVGETRSCGGIFMIRKISFHEAGGFNPSIIAGEEPELCYRLRSNGWKIHKIENVMAYHDASILKFSQWWKRAIRSGHAYAQGFALYGFNKEKFCLKDSLRIWFWAILLPVSILLLSILISPWISVFIFVYPFQFYKIAAAKNKSLKNWRLSFCYSYYNMIGKWAQLIGQFVFIKSRLMRKKQTIIEYK